MDEKDIMGTVYDKMKDDDKYSEVEVKIKNEIDGSLHEPYEGTSIVKEGTFKDGCVMSYLHEGKLETKEGTNIIVVEKRSKKGGKYYKIYADIGFVFQSQDDKTYDMNGYINNTFQYNHNIYLYKRNGTSENGNTYDFIGVKGHLRVEDETEKDNN